MEYETNIDLIKTGKIRKLTTVYKKRKEMALSVIRDAFNKSKNPYVAVSGGKDSIAMLALVSVVAKELKRKYVVWSHVSDASFPGTIETITNACKQLDVELILHESTVSAFNVVGKQSSKKFGKTGYFFNSIAKVVTSEKFDLAFVGVRKYESYRRRKATRIHGYLFKTHVPVECLVCYPLRDFQIQDVSATLVEYNMPIHPIYFKVPMGQKAIRLGYVTSLDTADIGSIAFLRKNYPKLYHKLVTIKQTLRGAT